MKIDFLSYNIKLLNCIERRSTNVIMTRTIVVPTKAKYTVRLTFNYLKFKKFFTTRGTSYTANE